MVVLAHDVIGPADGPLVVFLHGILGSRRNWLSFARRLERGVPGVRVAVVDLRGHGDTPVPAGEAPSVRACALDVGETAAALGEEPAIVVGHSFGGKVALAYARDVAAELRAVVVVDAPLGTTRAEGGLREIEQVLAILDEIPMPVPDRAALVERLLARGLSARLARWMTTNVRPGPGGLVWRFDLAHARALIADFAREDFHPWITAHDGAPRVVVVRGGRSDRFDDDELARLRAHADHGRLSLVVVPEAGHWVHTDDPEGLYAHVEPVVKAALARAGG